jgi:hypothetical protein
MRKAPFGFPLELVLAKLSIHENVCPRGALHSIQAAAHGLRSVPPVRPHDVGAKGRNVAHDYSKYPR